MNATAVAAFAGVLLAAATISALGVGAIRQWAEKRRLLDIPNERSSHVRPVPRGGGLAIVGVVLAGLAAAGLSGATDAPVLPGIVGTLLVAAVGWRDDVRSLPVSVRLAVHCIAAAVVLASGTFIPLIVVPGFEAIRIGSLAPASAGLVVVGLTNAYNFMDGIDGIAGGQAVVAGLGWAIAGHLIGFRMGEIVGVTIAGSALGFLVFNCPPARIFMGDVGSGALGFLFAWLSIAGGAADPRLPVAGLVFVWPFVFDTAFTLLRRLAGRENVFRAHRTHLYQRLVISGLSHAVVSATYCLLALLGTGLALWWLANGSNSGNALLVVLLIAASGLVAVVAWRERIATSRKEKIRVS